MSTLCSNSIALRDGSKTNGAFKTFVHIETVCINNSYDHNSNKSNFSPVAFTGTFSSAVGDEA